MKKIISILLVLFATLYSFSQQTKVQGKVTDASTDEPMPGVNIVVEGTTQGIITDIDGRYSIVVDNKNRTLRFSFMGYLQESVLIGEQQIIDVSLVPDIKALEEIIVIGYGFVKKADATGSVAVVSTKDFNKGTVNSVQELIVGKSAGVAISTNSGAPGNESTIRIRGGSSMSASNDPLIIIDGVPLDNARLGGSPNSLAALNPNDIETFTILKDASATAIFGARAANGVIIITTKRGTKEFKVTYNSTLSLATAPKKADVFSGDEYRALINEKYEGNDAVTSLLGEANTDWQSEIYRNAFAHDHNLNVSGTKGVLPYRVSLGYTNSNGALKTYNFERKTLSIGLDPSLLKDHLKIKINLKGMSNNNNFAEQGAITNAVYYDPTRPVYNGNNRWRGYTTWTVPVTNIDGNPNNLATANPVAQLDLTDNTSHALIGLGNIQLDYSFHFLPDLHANLNLGYEYEEAKGHNNVLDSTQWVYLPSVAGGRHNPYFNSRKNKLLDFYLNYSKDLEALQSHIEIMGGYSWSEFRSESNDSTMNEAETVTTHVNNYPTYYRLQSYFGRLIYSLKERYILTFTLRDDATSRFDSDIRWGIFPSVALAWKINEESFLKDSKILSDLKLRLGYGITGQQDVTSGDNFPYLARYTISDDASRYQLGTEFYNTLRPEGYDANIKWETTTTTNIGIDYGFLRNRITGSLDFYSKETEDLINRVDVPVGTNFSARVLTNVGSMENKGTEFEINAKIISKRFLTWDLGYNVTYNKNKITKLNLNDDPNFVVPVGAIWGTTSGTIQAHRIGYPVYSYYVYQQIYDTEGIPIEDVYIDRNEDGIINVSDLYCYKKPAADVLMGIVSQVNYKNWDLYFSGRVSLGNYVYNNASISSYDGLYSSLNFLQNSLKSLDKSKFSTGLNINLSDYYIENASFFKMDNISLGYKFTNIVQDKLNIHVGVTVQNVFVITKYSGIDPEINGGIDNNFYPRSRIFLLGINCKF